MKTKKNTLSTAGAHQSECETKPVETRSHLEKILVPIDFSCRSKKALQYAIHFAKQGKALLFLLHVLPAAGLDAGGEVELRMKLKAWAHEFVPGEIPVQIDVRSGAEVIEILDEAKRLAVDLMVVATHGRVGRAHALAGSLAERLVQQAPCPVLVIHEHEHDFVEAAEPEAAEPQAAARQEKDWGHAIQKEISPKFVAGDI